jgi:uncharacterized protein YchJ
MGAGGQWAAGEGVADGAHGFRVVKICCVWWCPSLSTQNERDTLQAWSDVARLSIATTSALKRTFQAQKKNSSSALFKREKKTQKHSSSALFKREKKNSAQADGYRFTFFFPTFFFEKSGQKRSPTTF